MYVMQTFVAYCFSIYQEVINFICVASSFLPCVSEQEHKVCVMWVNAMINSCSLEVDAIMNSAVSLTSVSVSHVHTLQPTTHFSSNRAYMYVVKI